MYTNLGQENGRCERMELKSLTEEQLLNLHKEVISLRKTVLDLVQKYEFQDSGSLVSQTFERQIETEYGRKVLKRLGKTGNETGEADGQ